MGAEDDCEERYFNEEDDGYDVIQIRPISEA